jgi:hypothetical protein
MDKQQLIQILIPKFVYGGAAVKDVKVVLETYTIPELEAQVAKHFPDTTDTAPSEAELSEAIQGVQHILDRSAKEKESQYSRDQQDFERFRDQERDYDIQHAKLEPAARALFQGVARVYNFSRCESNFQMLWENHLLDSPVSANDIPKSRMNGMSLAPPSDTELSDFAQEANIEYGERLRKMNPVELRNAVKAESEAARTAQVQADSDQQFKDATERDSYGSYPALPVSVTAEQIRQMTPERLRYTIKRFSNSAVTARLQGRN